MKKYQTVSEPIVAGRAALDQHAPAASGMNPARISPLRGRIGHPWIYDAVTGMTFPLPAGFLIHQSNGGIWLGSSADTRIFLYLERRPVSTGGLPTILVEGDLDLYLCSVRAPEAAAVETNAVAMAGSLGPTAIRGCLAQSRPENGYVYLVLTACFQTDEMTDLDEATRLILAAIDSGAASTR